MCCGPEAMLRAAAQVTQQHRVPCLVSLETPMACGIGICFTCVARIRQGEEWDYKRTCVEGPVFDARVGLLVTAHAPMTARASSRWREAQRTVV